MYGTKTKIKVFFQPLKILLLYLKLKFPKHLRSNFYFKIIKNIKPFFKFRDSRLKVKSLDLLLQSFWKQRLFIMLTKLSKKFVKFKRMLFIKDGENKTHSKSRLQLVLNGIFSLLHIINHICDRQVEFL